MASVPTVSAANFDATAQEAGPKWRRVDVAGEASHITCRSVFDLEDGV